MTAVRDFVTRNASAVRTMTADPGGLNCRI